jgi:hypothetical protein
MLYVYTIGNSPLRWLFKYPRMGAGFARVLRSMPDIPSRDITPITNPCLFFPYLYMFLFIYLIYY